jgi:DNA end-binding protein Ku
MRSIWTGAISFGLVNIPVKLYSAVQQQDIDLDMLAKKDLAPIRYARINKNTGKEVEYKDIVKGYEYEKGQYVVVTDEDFKKASPEKSKTIDISDFVKEEEIDSIYFDKPYYLEPDKGAAKAYALLVKALEKSKKVGIALFMIRNRARLGALKVINGMLVLNQLRYASEIRQPDELNVPKQEKVSPKEVELATKLIEQLTEHFEPENFHDTYVESLKKIIEAKAQGKPVKKTPVKRAKTDVKDIMSVLKESLKATKGKKAA